MNLWSRQGRRIPGLGEMPNTKQSRKGSTGGLFSSPTPEACLCLACVGTAVHALDFLPRLTGSLRESAGPNRNCPSVTRFLRSPARNLMSEGLCSVLLQPAGTYKRNSPPGLLSVPIFHSKGKTGSLKGTLE